MTGRERLLAAYSRRSKDRVPWTPIIMADTLVRYPPEERALGPIGFTKHIGADVLYRWGDFLGSTCDIERVDRCKGDTQVREWRTPAGALREVQQGSRLLEHKLKSEADLPAYRALIAHTSYVPNAGCYEELLAEVGDAGIVAPHIGPTAVQQIVQLDAGVDTFAYLCADCPAAMEETIDVLHQRDLERMRLAAETPAEVLIQVENTSTLLISPAMYRRWSRQHVRDFCRIAHEHGKVAMVHMCGHVKDLLADIAKTDLDGIDTLTPYPTGNTAPEDAWAVMGPELIVHGVLDPTAWIHRGRDQIESAVMRALPPGMKKRNFLLCTAADGLPDVPRETWDILREAWERVCDR